MNLTISIFIALLTALVLVHHIQANYVTNPLIYTNTFSHTPVRSVTQGNMTIYQTLNQGRSYAVIFTWGATTYFLYELTSTTGTAIQNYQSAFYIPTPNDWLVFSAGTSGVWVHRVSNLFSLPSGSALRAVRQLVTGTTWNGVAVDAFHRWLVIKSNTQMMLYDLNVADPTNPTLINTLTIGSMGDWWSMSMFQYRIVTSSGGASSLRVIDITPTGNSYQLTSTTTWNYPQCLTVKHFGDNVFCGGSSSGTKSSVINPSTGAEIRTYASGSFGTNVYDVQRTGNWLVYPTVTTLARVNVFDIVAGGSRSVGWSASYLTAITQTGFIWSLNADFRQIIWDEFPPFNAIYNDSFEVRFEGLARNSLFVDPNPLGTSFALNQATQFFTINYNNFRTYDTWRPDMVTIVYTATLSPDLELRTLINSQWTPYASNSFTQAQLNSTMRVYVRENSLSRNFTGTVTVTATNGRGSIINFTPLTVDYIAPMAVVTVQETRTVIKEEEVFKTVYGVTTVMERIENIFVPTCSAIPTTAAKDVLPQALQQMETALGIFIGGGMLVLGLLVVIIYVQCKRPSSESGNAKSASITNQPAAWWKPGGDDY